MLSLSQVEQDLTAAIRIKDLLKADVLRGLKARVQNEQIAKMSAKSSEGHLGGKELSENDILGLIRSEIKKRKEAATQFEQGGRPEKAEKELAELSILEKYLPAQMSEEELTKVVDQTIAESGLTAKDFGKAMGAIKARVGAAADGATLAKLLKEKLK